MAFAIPNGSRVNVAKAYLAPIIFTAASNATECELTVASAAGILAGDVVGLTLAGSSSIIWCCALNR